MKSNKWNKTGQDHDINKFSLTLKNCNLLLLSVFFVVQVLFTLSIHDCCISISHYSSQQSSDSSDSDMETLHLIKKRGADGAYKVNNEAQHLIRTIAETADKDPDFKLSDVDFSEFGQKVIDIDFDARTILFDSHKELQALKELTDEDASSGYGTMSSSASAVSFGSVGLPTIKR